MDVTLGVTVEETAARIALLDAAAPHTVIDQSEIDLVSQPIDTVVSTVVSTDRMLAESGHRLVGTRVCTSDPDIAVGLRNALIDADLTDVNLVSHSDAVTAVIRSEVGGETAASLVSGQDTAALSIIDAAAETTSLIAVEPVVDGDRGAAYRTLLERFSEEPGGATSVIVVGAPVDDALTADLTSRSPVPLRFPDQPQFAMARGAALAGFQRQMSPAGGDLDASLDSASTMLGPQAQQLAYSQVDDVQDFELAGAAVPMQTPMQPLSAVDPADYETEEDEVVPAKRPPALLLGSTIAAVVVVGFAALAVNVAINIRPQAHEQAVRVAEESVGGKYFPVAPGQGVAPDGPNWTMIEDTPPAGSEPEARTFRTQALGSGRGTGDTGAEVIKFYRDGTIGVVPDGNPIEQVAQGVGAGPGGLPEAPQYLTRLIPDFSRWSPCQVLGFVGNMRVLGQSAASAASSVAQSGTNTVTSLAGGTDGITDMTDLGVVAVVPDTKGALFDTTAKVTDTATDVGAIPGEIFKTGTKTGAVEPATSSVLPADTKILDTEALEALPTGGSETKTSLPILGEVIPPDVGAALPGTKGTAPVVETGSNPSLSLPGSTGGAPDTKLGIPGATPGDLLPGSTPSDGRPPVGPQLPDELSPKLDTPQLPTGREPKVDLPAPKVDLPEPKVDLPAPRVELPVPKVEAPPPKVDLPAPPVNIPEPKVDIPVPQAPVEAPAAPPVQAPKLPIIDLPLPVQRAPEADSPVAPEIPSLPSLPLLPELPFGGGLLGSGNG